MAAILALVVAGLAWRLGHGRGSGPIAATQTAATEPSPWTVEADLAVPAHFLPNFALALAPASAPEQVRYYTAPAAQNGPYAFVSTNFEYYGGYGATQEVFDLRTGARKGAVRTGGKFSFPVLSPDGEYFSARVYEGTSSLDVPTINTYAVKTGERLSRIGLRMKDMEVDGEIAGFAGSVLVVQSRAEGLRSFDALTGAALRAIAVPASGPLQAAALSPRGKYAAAVTREHLGLCKVETGELVGQVSLPATMRTLGEKELTAFQVAFSPDGRYVAAAFGAAARREPSRVYRVGVWDASSGRPLADMEVPMAPWLAAMESVRTERLFWSEDGQWLLVPPAIMFHVPDSRYNGTPRLVAPRQNSTLLGLLDGRTLLLAYESAAGPRDGSDRIRLSFPETTDVASRPSAPRHEIQVAATLASPYLGDRDPAAGPVESHGIVTVPDSAMADAAAFSPDGRTLALVIQREEMAILWDTVANRRIQALHWVERPNFWDHPPFFAADGKSVYVAAGTKTLEFDVATGKRRSETMGICDGVSLNGQWRVLASGSADLAVYDPGLKMGTRLAEGMNYGGNPCCVVSNDGAWAAAMSVVSPPRYWDAKTGTPLTHIAELRPTPHHCAFLPDNTLLVAGRSECLVLELATGNVVRRVPTPHINDIVSGVAVAPDGSLAAIFGNELTLLDPRTLKVVRKAGTSGVRGANGAFSPDSKKLAVCGAQTRIYPVAELAGP